MLKKYEEWANEKIKGMNIWDVKCIKWSAAAFTLMIAKLWAPILSLEWYWYAALGILFMLRPLKKVME
ncbi:MAG: hypothetical protein GOV01_02970 [Candidatus Altiarchaeota archaeon]|nr:hypothetical protein [Candidatus Altiarchaeota archaeon]